ncbi:hypothetical protein B7Y94_00310 [Candidatus Saccharibacteria bacterium 32-49-12]|nr:MAG: hypothetical protein B7Y94_00310 [Candidatus Saccharibacteria bacterium 32-49-12]
MILPDYFYIISLGLLGLVMGSFAGATVWRARARQLLFDKDTGGEVDDVEWKRLRPLTKASTKADRSRCLNCQKPLRWFNLIPLVSWLYQHGRCQACQQPIGRFEPLIEVSVAAVFIASYVFWPGEIASSLAIAEFVVWLMAVVVMAILFAYDAKWFLLQDRHNLALAVVGTVTTGIAITGSSNPSETLLSALGAVGVLSGIYLLLYLVSKGRWIGFGDIKLGVGLGLLLVDWKLAILAFFMANLIGCLYVIPGMLSGRLGRQSQVPFGPFLILGTIIAKLFGAAIIAWYVSILA